MPSLIACWMMQMKVQSYVENLIPVEAAILKSSQNATSANSHRVNVVPAFGVCSFSFFCVISFRANQPHSVLLQQDLYV